jgi:hypothetical protein
MADLGDDASVRADDVKADPAWVARLEAAVFGKDAEWGTLGYGKGFTPIYAYFTPMISGDELLKPWLPDARKYELVMENAKQALPKP